MDEKGSTSLFGVLFNRMESMEGKPIQVVKFQGKVYAAPSLITELERAGSFSRFKAMLSDVQGMNADADVSESVDAALPRWTNLEGPGVPASELLNL